MPLGFLSASGRRGVLTTNNPSRHAAISVAAAPLQVQVSLGHQLRAKAPGLTVRQLLEKFSRMQMMDVHFPTTDGRELVFRRYTQPEGDEQLLLAQMNWELPPPALPRIAAKGELENGYKPSGCPA